MTLEQLKSRAYDCMVLIENYKRLLRDTERMIEEEIQSQQLKNQEEAKAAKPEKVDKKKK